MNILRATTFQIREDCFMDLGGVTSACLATWTTAKYDTETLVLRLIDDILCAFGSTPCAHLCEDRDLKDAFRCRRGFCRSLSFVAYVSLAVLGDGVGYLLY